MNFYENPEYQIYGAHNVVEKLSEQFSRMNVQRVEWFLRYCALRYVPKEVFDIAEQHKTMHVDLIPVSVWMDEHGYHQRCYPSGKIEFAQTQADGSVNILETLEP